MSIVARLEAIEDQMKDATKKRSPNGLVDQEVRSEITKSMWKQIEILKERMQRIETEIGGSE